ncbi:OmpA family protein [Dawidia soli]|uniref:OmpA family protein n=1 Tax=Dawidia soli TaxID=2782352 RepID=A0AAP2DBL2_9BACT|nr:OmpA family protein [Dawidia soli]MBT1688949.1 OmpA family protein [Dawidia soli]
MARLLFTLLFLLPLPALAQQAREELRRSIYFGGGSYEIDEFQADALYQWLDSIPDLLEKYQLQLISHTDPIGGRAFNEWLSEMRGEAVLQLLIQKNIPSYRINIKNWGLDNPVYSNKTFNGMQLNRRVDVILYPIVY